MGAQSEQHRFIDDEILQSVFRASLSRGKNAPIYKQGVSDSQKREFRDFIKQELRTLAAEYRAAISQDEHVENVTRLQKRLNERGTALLHAHGTDAAHITFGRAQKLLNLYLKFCWCLGWTNEPPQCPLDSLILAELRCNSPCWTSARFQKENYVDAMRICAVRAGNGSIAQWELDTFNRRRNSMYED